MMMTMKQRVIIVKIWMMMITYLLLVMSVVTTANSICLRSP